MTAKNRVVRHRCKRPPCRQGLVPEAFGAGAGHPPDVRSLRGRFLSEDGSRYSPTRSAAERLAPHLFFAVM